MTNYENEARRPTISMRGITKSYYIGKPNELDILHGIDLEVYEGEFVAIVGESGSGKSTLMNIIGALDRPTSGEYSLDGVDVKSANDEQLSEIRNKKIGFVFQTFNLIGRQSALKNVELPMLYAKVKARQRTKRAKELLEMVNMSSRLGHQPNELLIAGMIPSMREMKYLRSAVKRPGACRRRSHGFMWLPLTAASS